MESALRSILSLLLLFVICAGSVCATFTVSVRVLRYRNLMNSAISSCDDSAEDPCGHYFTFCLQLGGGNSVNPSTQPCPLGQQQTQIALSTDVSEAAFGTTGFLGLQNPIPFTGAEWPGSARLLVEVDEGDNDNIIDRILVELEAPQGSMLVEPTVFTGENQNIQLQMEINVMTNITGATLGADRRSAGGLVAGVLVAVTLFIGISIALTVAVALLLRRIVTAKSISGEQRGSHQEGLTIGDNPTYGDSPLQVPNNHNPDSPAMIATEEPNALECSYHRYEPVSADSVIDSVATSTCNNREQQQPQGNLHSHPNSRNELEGSHSYEYIVTPHSANHVGATEASTNANGKYWHVGKQQVSLGRLQPDIAAHYETCTT